MKASLPSLVLGVVLGLILGFGGAFIASDLLAGESSGPQAITLGPGGGASIAPTRRQGELATPLVQSSADASVAEAETAMAAPRLSEARVRDLATRTRVPTTAREAGEGLITGNVTDLEGDGVAGVVIRTSKASGTWRKLEPAKVGAAAPPIDSLEDAVRKAAEKFSEQRAHGNEAVTDAGGAFRIEGLPQGMWTVQAYKQDHVLESVGSVYRVPTGGHADFVAKPVQILTVEVLAPDGSPASSATISCKTPDESSRPALYEWSQAQRTLRLAPGRYEITALQDVMEGRSASQEAISRLRSESQTVDLKSSETAEPLVLQLGGHGGIRGVVTFVRDIVAPQPARVVVAPVASDSEVDLEQLAGSKDSTSVQPGGSFGFLDLEQGLYAVGVKRSWGGPVVAYHTVVVEAELVEFDLEVPAIELAEFIQVVAHGPSGERLESLSFGFQHEADAGGSTSSSGLRPMVTIDGLSLVTVPEHSRTSYYSESTSDTFQLTVTHSEFGSKSIDLQPGQGEVEVSFAPPAALEVTVAGYRSSDLQGRLSVGVRELSEDVRHYYSQERGLSPSGSKTVEALEPGQYGVTLYLRDRSETNRWNNGNAIATTPVDLVPGANSVQIAIPTLYSLSIYAPGLDEGTRISLQSSSGSLQSYRGARTDGDGRALIDELPVGPYTVRVGGRKANVEVPCSEVVLEEAEEEDD